MNLWQDTFFKGVKRDQHLQNETTRNYLKASLFMVHSWFIFTCSEAVMFCKFPPRPETLRLKVDAPGKVDSPEKVDFAGKVNFPRKLSSRESWLPGKVDFPQKLTSRKKLTSPKSLLPGKFDCPGLTLQEIWHPEKIDFLGNLASW